MAGSTRHALRCGVTVVGVAPWHSVQCFLDVKVSPRVKVATLKVAPHGLIGQTYDGDGVGIIGKTDDYKPRDNTVRHHHRASHTHTVPAL